MKKILHTILPGIFLIGFNIGTGSVTAMAKAGANYGMAMLWTILLSCLVTYYLIQIFGKFTIVTGETAIGAFRKHIHPVVGLFFLLAISINVSGSIMGVMGIISDILFVWSKTWVSGGISPILWASVITVLVYLLFYAGNVNGFKKVLSIIVMVMGVSFLLNFFIMMPSLKEIANGLIPGIPDSTNLSDSGGPLLVTASMVGTTVASIIFIIRSILVKEEGWKIEDLKIQKRDAAVSASLMFVLSAAIMASAAGTLFVNGIALNNASEMIGLLEPIAGKTAVAIFVIGITAAGISSQFPNILVVPWILKDYSSDSGTLRQNKYRIIAFFMALLGLVVPLFKGSPVFVMLASQAFGAIVLPATVICIFYLTSKKSIMGVHANNLWNKIILVLITIFSIFMGSVGIRGFISDIL